jgi:Mg2+/Co2+ transporter CorB
METSELLDTAFWGTVAGILCLLVMSGFFSGSETALTASSRGKLRAMGDRGSKGALKALEVREDGERLIGAILLGNNVVNILAASLATALFTRLFGESGVALATLVMTALVLVFSEVLPKTLAITMPEPFAARVARPIGILIKVLAPVVTAVRFIVRLVLRAFGVRTDPEGNVLSVREEIAGALAIGHSEGIVHKEDRDRLLGALDLSDRTVEEIMRHRSHIEMLDADAPPADIVSQCLASPHTRLPLYRGEKENIVGVIHAKDLLRAVDKLLRGGEPGTVASLDALDVTSVAMKPYFIPETTPLDDQMRQFLKRHTHFALVVDEYGALRGLITLEDILEEIVGEITDEFDEQKALPFQKAEDGAWVVDGATTIRDINRALEWQLPDEEANTVAGLVIHEAQLIPNPGQVFSFHGCRFEVVERQENRLTLLRIRPL